MNKIHQIDAINELPKYFIAFTCDTPIDKVIDRCTNTYGFKHIETIYIYNKRNYGFIAVEINGEDLQEWMRMIS